MSGTAEMNRRHLACGCKVGKILKPKRDALKVLSIKPQNVSLFPVSCTRAMKLSAAVVVGGKNHDEKHFSVWAVWHHIVFSAVFEEKRVQKVLICPLLPLGYDPGVLVLAVLGCSLGAMRVICALCSRLLLRLHLPVCVLITAVTQGQNLKTKYIIRNIKIGLPHLSQFRSLGMTFSKSPVAAT